jgi:hypothetical protein
VRKIIQKLNNDDEIEINVSHEDFFRRKIIVDNLKNPIMREKLKQLYDSKTLPPEKAEMLNELFEVKEIIEIDRDDALNLIPLEDN